MFCCAWVITFAPIPPLHGPCLQLIPMGEAELSSGMHGTISHMPPESMKRPTSLTLLTDVYSFGVVLWEMYTQVCLTTTLHAILHWCNSCAHVQFVRPAAARMPCTSALPSRLA